MKTTFFSLYRRLARLLNNGRIVRMAWRVARAAPAPARYAPGGLFSKSPAGWMTFLEQRVPPAHLVGVTLAGRSGWRISPARGMSRRVLGTNRHNPAQPLPCRSCIFQAKTLYLVFRLTCSPFCVTNQPTGKTR